MTTQNTFIALFRTILDKPYWQKDVTYRGLNGTKEKVELHLPLDVTYLGASVLLERLSIKFKRLKIKEGTKIVPIGDTTVTSVGDLAIVIQGLFHGVCLPIKTERFHKRQQGIFDTLDTLSNKTESFLKIVLLATDQLYQDDKVMIRSLQPLFLDILHMGLARLKEDSLNIKEGADWKQVIDHPTYRQFIDAIENIYKETNFQSEEKLALQQKMFFLLAATEFAPFQRDSDWSEYNRHCAIYAAYSQKNPADSRHLLLLSQLLLLKSTEDPTKYSTKEREHVRSINFKIIGQNLPDSSKAPEHPELFLRLLYLVCCKNADTTLYWYQPNTPPPSRFIDDAATYNYDKGLTTLTSKFFFDYLNGEYSAILKETTVDSRAMATLLATILAETAKLPEQDFLTWYNEQLALSGPLDTPKQLHDFFESSIEALNIEVNFYQMLSQEKPLHISVPSYISPAMLRKVQYSSGTFDPFDSLEGIILHSPTPEMLKELPNLFPRMEHLTIKGACTEETLQHLEKCTNIRYLTLKELALTAIPNIAKLRYLQSLDLSHNKLKFIDPFALSQLRALQSLDLSHNKLKFIDPFALSELRSLDLSYNWLHTFPKFHTDITISYEGNVFLENPYPINTDTVADQKKIQFEQAKIHILTNFIKKFLNNQPDLFEETVKLIYYIAHNNNIKKANEELKKIVQSIIKEFEDYETIISLFSTNLSAFIIQHNTNYRTIANFLKQLQQAQSNFSNVLKQYQKELPKDLSNRIAQMEEQEPIHRLIEECQEEQRRIFTKFFEYQLITVQDELKILKKNFEHWANRDKKSPPKAQAEGEISLSTSFFSVEGQPKLVTVP